jgi:hypothetical protein
MIDTLEICQSLEDQGLQRKILVFMYIKVITTGIDNRTHIILSILKRKHAIKRTSYIVNNIACKACATLKKHVLYKTK